MPTKLRLRKIRKSGSGLCLLLTILLAFPSNVVFSQVQPTIVWNAPDIEVALAGGTSKRVTNITVTSNLHLENVSYVPSRQIARFLKVYGNPTHATQPGTNPVSFDFQIPEGTRVGVYQGTVNAFKDGSAISSSFNVTIRIVAESISLYGNPGDPLLVKTRTQNGRTLEYFGKRDAAGVPIAIDAFKISDSNGESTYLFDPQGRPTRYVAASGVRFDLNWVTNTSMVLTARSLDGKTAVTLPVDLNSIDVGSNKRRAECVHCNASRPETAKQIAPSNLPFETLRPNDLSVSDFGLFNSELSENCDSNRDTPPSTGASNSFVVRVSRCGSPLDDADVSLNGVPMQSTGSGIFQTSIPRPNPAAGQDFVNTCQGFSGTLSNVCEFIGNSGLSPQQETALVTAIAFQLFQALILIPGVNAYAAVVATAFIGFSEGLSLFCSAWTPFCVTGGILIDQYNNRDITFDLRVRTDSATLGQFIGPLNAMGPFSAVSVDIPANTTIVTSITTSSPVPDASVGYTATASISCRHPSAILLIRVEGQDGYQQTQVCSDSSSICSISVPGNRSTSQDLVTVIQAGDLIKSQAVRLTMLGSVLVADNGPAADDAFSVTLDGQTVGQTTVGGANEFSIRNLSSGQHQLRITAIVAPDNGGTYGVTLRSGLRFISGGTSQSGVLPLGGSATFTIVVP